MKINRSTLSNQLKKLNHTANKREWLLIIGAIVVSIIIMIASIVIIVKQGQNQSLNPSNASNYDTFNSYVKPKFQQALLDAKEKQNYSIHRENNNPVKNYYDNYDILVKGNDYLLRQSDSNDFSTDIFKKDGVFTIAIQWIWLPVKLILRNFS